jgi:hypothetical protein
MRITATTSMSLDNQRFVSFVLVIQSNSVKSMFTLTLSLLAAQIVRIPWLVEQVLPICWRRST